MIIFEKSGMEYGMGTKETGARRHARQVIRDAKVAAPTSPTDHWRVRVLTVLAQIGNHIAGCPVCRRTWFEGDTPIEHINRWAMDNPEAKPFYLAAARQARAVNLEERREELGTPTARPRVRSRRGKKLAVTAGTGTGTGPRG